MSSPAPCFSELEKLAANCAAAAQYYAEKPELAGPRAVIDIYQAIAHLAWLIDAQHDSTRH